MFFLISPLPAVVNVIGNSPQGITSISNDGYRWLFRSFEITITIIVIVQFEINVE